MGKQWKQWETLFFGAPQSLQMVTAALGATLGITDKMEARPQPRLLILQAWPWDEGVRPCDSDLFFPFFS